MKVFAINELTYVAANDIIEAIEHCGVESTELYSVELVTKDKLNDDILYFDEDDGQVESTRLSILLQDAESRGNPMVIWDTE